MKQINKALIFCLTIALTGCASKEPTIITKTVFQEVKVPISCIKKMPIKPEFKADNLESALELMKYFKTCEELLKGCVDE